MNPLANSPTYIPDPGLAAVIDLSLRLGMPLLVTGEPGTGKTRLAYYVAEKLGLDRPLIFNTKTDSQARDLFYHYDAIRHFRDAGQDGKSVNPMDYLSFQALGQAILESDSRRHVVLIDEIDKAPRDFPNDLLYEFEHQAFQVKEANVEEVKARVPNPDQVDAQGFLRMQKPENRPVLILTSNSEKNLPDAFMRRVLYYHIEFPNTERLRQIVQANVQAEAELEEKMLKAALDHFLEIRTHKRLRKPPATAELLAWIHVLNEEKIDLESGLKASGERTLKEKIFQTYSLIAKNKEDLARLKDDLGL